MTKSFSNDGKFVLSLMLRNQSDIIRPVSYTHLTLPTNREV